MKWKAVASAAPLFLAALALSGCVSASGAPMNFAEVWSSAGFVSVAIAAVFLSMFFVSLGFMLGYAFRQPRVVAWARNEFYQVLASALLVAFMLWFITALSSLTYDLTSGTAICAGLGASAMGAAPPPGQTTASATGWTTAYHINCAHSIVKEAEEALIVQANQLVSLNMRIQFLAGFVKSFDVSMNPTMYTGVYETVIDPTYSAAGPTFYPFPFPANRATGIEFNPYAGVTMLGDSIGLMMPFLFAWIASFIAQGFMLALVDKALFPILLVLGIILRTFFFTRKLGGLLLAIALCLYTIYPMMYILFAHQVIIDPGSLWIDRWSALTCNCDKSGTPSPALTAIGTVGAPALYAFTGWTDANCPVRFCWVDVFSMIFVGITPSMLALSQLEWLFITAEVIGRAMVSAVFVPLLITIITVASIKGLSPLLGGDVEIAGLTHLI